MSQIDYYNYYNSPWWGTLNHPYYNPGRKIDMPTYPNPYERLDKLQKTIEAAKVNNKMPTTKTIEITREEPKPQPLPPIKTATLTLTAQELWWVKWMVNKAHATSAGLDKDVCKRFMDILPTWDELAGKGSVYNGTFYAR